MCLTRETSVQIPGSNGRGAIPAKIIAEREKMREGHRREYTPQPEPREL